MNQMLGAGLGFVVAATAHAGMVDIGGGWTASWNGALDGTVDIFSVTVTTDAVVIQKSIEFFDFGPVDVVFTQTALDAKPYIVIDDEILTNSTGQDWTDFHMELSGGATFNPALTTGGDPPINWTISPFTNAAFGAGDTTLDIDGGVVPDGGVYFPGNGATDGLLYINANPSPSGGASFTLTEYPTPTPGSLALFSLGGIVAFRRHRR